MSMSPRPAVTPQAVVGVSICLMGIALTLDNLGLFELRSIVELWPVVPISIGVLTLMYGQSKQDYVKGTLWLALGTFFIFRHPLMREVWPLLLIALGGYLVWRSRTGPPPARKWEAEVVLTQDPPDVAGHPFGPPVDAVGSSAGSTAGSTVASPSAAGSSTYAGPTPSDLPPPIPESYRRERPKTGPFGCGTPRSHFTASGPSTHVPPASGAATDASGAGSASGRTDPGQTDNVQRPALFALMSGVRRQVKGIFAGGEATAIMGGVELDLRFAVMGGDEVTIDTFALWGGIEIWVPQNWEVVSQGLPLMGAFEDKTHLVQQPRQPRLVIRGVAVMGSVEIKN